MDVYGGNTNSHTLTGLINGQTYTISIVGTSSSSAVIPSAPVLPGRIGLGTENSYSVMCKPFLWKSTLSHLLLSLFSGVRSECYSLFHSSTSSSTQ